MNFDFGAINWWAVLVAAVAAFVIGGIWYGGAFAKAWVSLNKYTDDDVQAMAKKQGLNFACFFLCEIIMAIVIALLVINLEITAWTSGLVLGAVLWLGVAATFGFMKNIANNKPLALWFIDGSHELAVLLAMGAIIGGWR